MKPNLKILIALRQAGIRQKHLARMVGVPESVISQVILGRLNIDPARQLKIAKALGGKVVDLFDEAPAPSAGSSLPITCLECRSKKP